MSVANRAKESATSVQKNVRTAKRERSDLKETKSRRLERLIKK